MTYCPDFIIADGLSVSIQVGLRSDSLSYDPAKEAKRVISPKYIAMGAAGLMLGVVTGCGAHQPRHNANPQPLFPTLTVRTTSMSTLSRLPLTVAQKLGLFADVHVKVVWTQSEEAEATVGIPGSGWPIVGYVSTRPDLVLVSPVPDPHFRLRALNHLPMVYANPTAPEQGWAQSILAAHRATVSHWDAVPFREILSLWKHHHLPWVLVTLSEANRLEAIDHHSVVLAWLGASTGPVPSTVVSARQDTPRVMRFLRALNIALWYLQTSRPATLAEVLSPDRASPRVLAQALHYHYWPVTTYPDTAAFDRARARFQPEWPTYGTAVNPTPAAQALNETGA